MSRWPWFALLQSARSLRVLGAVAALMFATSWTDDASAYAWMIRHNYAACGTCHADPSGGELLTQYGRVTSDIVLRTHYGKKKEGEEEKAPDTGMLWGLLDLPDQLLLSGTYRNLYVIRPTTDDVFAFVPVMQLDLYGQLRFGRFTMGGSLGLTRVSGTSPHGGPAQVTPFTAEDGGKAYNMVSRTHYLGYDIGSDFVLRAGRLNLPFGVRIPEHTAWVREATRTDRESDQQHGVGLAYTGENFRGELMAIAGNYQIKLAPGGEFSTDAIRERGYSFYLEGMGSTSFAAGISSKVTYARLDRITQEEKSVRQAHGVTLRWALHHKFSLMGEADVLFRSRANAGYVFFAQADYEPVQGLHLMLTGEGQDQGMPQQQSGQTAPEPQPGVGRPQFGGWFSVDWFFFKQMEFRTDLVLRQNQPLTIWGQLHFYL